MSYYESSIIYLALKFITCYGKNDQSGINIFFFKRYDAQLFYVIIYISISNEYSKIFHTESLRINDILNKILKLYTINSYLN